MSLIWKRASLYIIYTRKHRLTETKSDDFVARVSSYSVHVVTYIYIGRGTCRRHIGNHAVTSTCAKGQYTRMCIHCNELQCTARWSYTSIYLYTSNQYQRTIRDTNSNPIPINELLNL